MSIMGKITIRSNFLTQPQLIRKINTHHNQICCSTRLLGDCLTDIFTWICFAKKNKRLLCKRSIAYEMQFQIEDGSACLCFSLFP